MRMKNTIKKILVAVLGALCLVMLLTTRHNAVKADEIIEIHNYNDLLKMADNPDGSYKLMQDIDCKGKEWKPVDFTGFFDGNGYSVLNLSIRQCSDSIRTTYDGNMVEYDTSFSGFFGCLENAEILNLKLLGINIDINTAAPCFAGAVAGYMDNSTISGCDIEGRISITTTGKSFGVGGIVGFGMGQISLTKADVTLVCVDRDVEDKDEQFMGGAYAAGYVDLSDNEIIIKGYDSDHGYVHDGGLVGMYIQYPEGTEHDGEILGNTVSGFITFYEDNEDRRAYCEAYVGEILGGNFAYDDEFDADNFIRDEIWFEDLLNESGYYDENTNIDPADVIIKEHSCENPQYDKKVIESTESTNGYLMYSCKNCDYSYKTEYMVRKGTPEEIITTEEALTEPETQQPEKKGNKKLLFVIIAVTFVVVLLLVVLLIKASRTRKAVAARRRKVAQDQRRKQQSKGKGTRRK